MAASEALDVQGASTATAADPTAGQAPGVASVRFPQLIPIAQLIAIVLGVFAIIWNQQQGDDNLRTEIHRVETTLRAEINGVETTLRAEINGVETTLRAELGGAIEELRAEVASNGQRLARIEGHLGIGVPDDPPE